MARALAYQNFVILENQGGNDSLHGQANVLTFKKRVVVLIEVSVSRYCILDRQVVENLQDQWQRRLPVTLNKCGRRGIKRFVANADGEAR